MRLRTAASCCVLSLALGGGGIVSHQMPNKREEITTVAEHIEKIRAFWGQGKFVKGIESCPIKLIFHANAFMISWMITTVMHDHT